MTRTARKLPYPVLLLLITIAFFWKVALSGQYTWLDASDIARQVVPWLQVEATQWHTGHFPLWDPHVWAGQPLIGQVQPGTLNPLNWILFSIPLDQGFIRIAALNWYWVTIHYLAALFCYLLCRDLGLSQMASVFGGCAFGLGGFMGAIVWPQMLMSALLLPLILMFFLRVLRGENATRNAAASGALLGASFLGGHHNVPIFFTLVMAGLWIYYFAQAKPPVEWRRVAPPAAFFVCFALIAAAQVLPAIELGKASLRWVNGPHAMTWEETVPYNVHESFSLYPTGILGIVIQGFQHNSEVFVGLVVLTLALLAVSGRWNDRTVRILGAIGLGGLVFSLGGFSLFHGILYEIVPGLDKVRSPSMAEAIFHLGVVVLAAYGLDWLRSSEIGEMADRIAVRLLAALSLFLYAALVVMITVRPEQGEEYKELSLAALVAILLAAILLLWKRARLSNGAAGVLLILLLLFELNNVSNYHQVRMEAASNLRGLAEHGELAAFLKRTGNLSRVDVDRGVIPYNFGDWYGVDELGGFLASAPKSIAETQGDPRYRSLLAVNYFIGAKPARPEQTVAFEGQGGLKVFLNPGAFPRARMVHRAMSVPDDQGVISAVVNPSTDLQRTVVLEGAAPELGSCDGGSVEVRRYRPTSVVLRTTSPCRAMVILADGWFPGWKATVDGRPARIYAAYNIIRGVVVDAGEHELVMVYRPASVFTGMALALAGIAICIGLQFARNI
jgi:hypothetical protein